MSVQRLFGMIVLCCAAVLGKAQGTHDVANPDKVTKGKYLRSSDVGAAKALEQFKKVANSRDQIIFAELDYIYRVIPVKGTSLGPPSYRVGRVLEDYATGDFLIDSLVLRPVKFEEPDNDNLGLPAERIDSPQPGKVAHFDLSEDNSEIEWEQEFERLQAFVAAQRSGTFFDPVECKLEPISQFFQKRNYAPKSGGAFISSSEMCFQWKIGSQAGVIDPPGVSIPHWIEYFDPRALGFASRREIEHGASLGAVLRRYNTGVPFGVDRFETNAFVSIAFPKAISRFLVTQENACLPVYFVDYRGEPRGGNQALIVERPKVQSWVDATEVNNVWVPTRVRLLDHAALIDIELKWHSVNQPFVNSPFVVESIALQPGTKIVDRRVTPPSVRVIRGVSR